VECTFGLALFLCSRKSSVEFKSNKLETIKRGTSAPPPVQQLIGRLFVPLA